MSRGDGVLKRDLAGNPTLHQAKYERELALYARRRERVGLIGSPAHPRAIVRARAAAASFVCGWNRPNRHD